MATKVTKSSQLPSLNQDEVIRVLRRRAGKREGVSNFIGLKRSSALADVENPSDALNNVLDKISLVLDAGERNIYKRPYNSSDWRVTRDFVEKDINREFLSQLQGASIGGGILGSTVLTTPRIRIQDRISLLNSFYGEGSLPGLHSGPNAQFYRSPGSQVIGSVKFTIDVDNNIDLTELKAPDGSTNITESDVLDGGERVVLDIDSYQTPGGVLSSLSGTNTTLILDSPNSWSVNQSSGRKLNSIKGIVGELVFGQLKFKISRQYSLLNPPLWFTESPDDSGTNIPGSGDDNDPETSSKVLVTSSSGDIIPYVEKGYWFTRAYVENRWTSRERTLVGDNSITQDSNMRWQTTPSPLKGEEYNWGIRWEGYLRITPGIYALQVQTNVSIKIDMDLGGWTNVFDTSTAAQESEDTYISGQSFDTDSLDSKYKYFFGDNLSTDWVAYVPIVIRMFNGGPDKAFPGLSLVSEPNLFIKTTKISQNRNWYRETFNVTLSGTDGNWVLTGPKISDLKSIREDSLSSISYSLISKDGQFFPSPVSISLSVSGGNLISNTTGLQAGNYELLVSPVRGPGFDSNLQALWKGRIASPSPSSKLYTDLTDSGYTPDQLRVPFDFRPPWWKFFDGSPYNRSDSPDVENTPLDGFIRNTFKSTLKSDVDGLGLYGNGLEPPTYSQRPNIILGESRYSLDSPKGSSYIGIKLTSNSLGEGGLFLIDSLPINNSVFNDSLLLGANDLGGSPNHLTIAGGKQTPHKAIFTLQDDDTDPDTYNKYFLFDGTPTQDDDPEDYGLPAFSSPVWDSPITIQAVRVADDIDFTDNVRPFVDVFVMGVEKILVSGYNVLAFTTTLSSILDEGEERNLFDGKYIEFYTESDLDYSYQRVDSGSSLSFSDVLKLTYDESDDIIPLESEIPRPPSSRVTPWGFDLAETSSGICYPPYATVNELLSDTAVSDEDLYDSPVGNYDVIWGDATKADLGSNNLTITEKLEFSGDSSCIETISTPVTLSANAYSHRIKIDFPVDETSVPEDATEYIGNKEKVKDFYFLYVSL